MPGKRTHRQRRHNTETLDRAWIEALETGYDFFGELADLGVPVDVVGVPDMAHARAAWGIYGERVLARPRHPSLGATWGETQFGRPGNAR